MSGGLRERLAWVATERGVVHLTFDRFIEIVEQALASEADTRETGLKPSEVAWVKASAREVDLVPGGIFDIAHRAILALEADTREGLDAGNAGYSRSRTHGVHNHEGGRQGDGTPECREYVVGACVIGFDPGRPGADHTVEVPRAALRSPDTEGEG